ELARRQETDVDGATGRTILICLRVLYREVAPELASEAEGAWTRLSQAVHHHAYELSPTVSEVEDLAASVVRIAEYAGRTGSGRELLGACGGRAARTRPPRDLRHASAVRELHHRSDRERTTRESCDERAPPWPSTTSSQNLLVEMKHANRLAQRTIESQPLDVLFERYCAVHVVDRHTARVGERELELPPRVHLVVVSPHRPDPGLPHQVDAFDLHPFGITLIAAVLKQLPACKTHAGDRRRCHDEL